ncbi:MAG: hypothetical protein J1E64_10000 [Acetatifactor sp.]|nr:hypothetical protein [Acetatifactor sp.]
MAEYIFYVLPGMLAIIAAAVVILFQINLSKMQKLADNATPVLRENEDGTYELSWSSLEDTGADSYYVDVGTLAVFSENGRRTFFSGYVDDVSCHLPKLPAGEGLVLEMELIKNYSVLGKEHTLKLASIQRYFYIWDAMINNLDWEVDPDAGIAYINLDYQEANSCSIYVTEQSGEKRFLKVVDGNSLELNLNEEEGLWRPTPGNPCTLTFMPGNRANGMALYGGESKEMTVTWEEFASRDIDLALEVIDGCVCYLEWNKMDCDFYEIQMMDGDVGVWETVKTVAGEDECTYVSPRLSPGAGYSFRVAVVLGDYAAVSETRECEMTVTPLYCTVWPVKDLKAYSDAAKSKVVGEVKALDAYCVVEAQDDMFGINVNDSVCYIDSNYCMIDLQEYVGALCSYNITNSYDSIFMAHGFEIPDLTGEVVKGFENVRLMDDSFLVPLLYPAARRLETAIENARENGCRLKIYDAFRPHEASVYMYQKASEIQYMTLPESAYWEDTPGVIPYVREIDENGSLIERRKTYWELMNGSNNFILGNFVSAGVSRHNLGVALDLTLEYPDTGYELPMQTDIHDLSWYSARAQNNENAKLLSDIMISAGFNGISSEWWHFQDDKIRSKLSLPCVNNGVTAECWMTNGFGWRYRYADGTYAVNCMLTIDGKDYTFDPEGYVQNQGETE